MPPVANTSSIQQMEKANSNKTIYIMYKTKASDRAGHSDTVINHCCTVHSPLIYQVTQTNKT